MAWAFVTGASSGIGYEFSKILAREGYDVFLVARRKDRLIELKAEIENLYKQQAEVIEADLTEASQVHTAFERTKEFTESVEVLVNNAGFGQYGAFHKTDLAKNLSMIDLNVRALTQLSHLFSEAMVKKNLGFICNVASTAAFQPGPMMAVYFATKAYVLSFSEALAEELADHNIAVSALCPGPTQSEFGKNADFSDSGVMKNVRLPDSKSVAEFGYKAMKEGRSSAVHGTLNKLMAQSNRFVPRSFSAQMTKKLISKS